MKSPEFIVAYQQHYKLSGLMDYARCSGTNLFHKKVLIWILREKFRLSFPKIGIIFRNNHATIMYHYQDICRNPKLGEAVADAWKLYRNN